MYSTFDLPFSIQSQYTALLNANVGDLPTNCSNSFRFVEASQVEEVWVLMVLVEDGTGAVFEIVGCEDCDTVSRELLGECGAPVVVFES